MAKTLDLFEYHDNAAAQAAYVSSKATGPTISENLITGRDAYINIYGANGSYEEAAQSFQTSENITCLKVRVQIKAAGSPADSIICEIQTDDSGPSGDLVNENATKSLAASGISASYEWVTFEFPASFSLTASITYHIVLRRSGARSTPNRIQWGIDETNGGYANGLLWNRATGTWLDTYAGGNADGMFEVYKQTTILQCYSESTTKQQGSYSLKVFAELTESLNQTLTRTVAPTINLSGINSLELYCYASRTGTNIEIRIHDSGGTTTTKSIVISSADEWEKTIWDISGVADANKDAIDQIVIKITNANAANTFYVDNFYGVEIAAYPIGRLNKNRITGYHCFMDQYMRAKREELAPLKLPDGTLW